VADAIFISYRRDDSEGEAGRLFDDLVRAFGNDAVFMDVAAIKPGVDFRKAIEDNVASCGVLLAIVGPAWASIIGADGKRRLEDPNDFVALEIGSALRREVPVIPVLVHDAKMPSADLLPESLKSFCYRNSVELSHARWNSDVSLLVEALKSYVKPVAASPVHATVTVQLPSPHLPTVAREASAKASKLPVKAGISVAAVLAIAIAVYFAVRKPAASDTGTTPAPGSSSAPAVAPASSQANPAPFAPSTPMAKTAADPIAEYVGTWRRTGGAGDGDALGMLVVSGSKGAVTIHAYGRCQAANCDWGAQPAVMQGANIVATFTPSPSGSDTSRTALVTAHPTTGGLDVLVLNNFQNPTGPRRSSSHHLFANAQ
jgi:hypothetical protein